MPRRLPASATSRSSASSVLGVLLVISRAAAVMLPQAASARIDRRGGDAEMQMLSQRLARGTALASQGQAAAFPGLKDSRERFKADLDALQNGGNVKGVSLDAPSDDTVSKILQDIKGRWDRVDVNAGRVLENQQSLTTLAKGLDNINQGNNAILELAQQAAEQVGQGGGSLREIEYANQLAVLSQRIAKNANALASSGEIDPEVAFLLGKDAGTFRDILNGLLKGSDALRLTGVRNEEARGTLTELQKRFAAYDQGVAAILQNMNRLVSAKQAARGINNESDSLLSDTTKLAEQFESGSRTRGALWAAIAFVVLGLVFLVLLGKVFLDDARIRAVESEGENKRNQEAILRLLNEMGNLADGDLTVQASVTEDVTGAIADSINFTIEELRTLVKGINSATDQVAKATQDARRRFRIALRSIGGRTGNPAGVVISAANGAGPGGIAKRRAVRPCGAAVAHRRGKGRAGRAEPNLGQRSAADPDTRSGSAPGESLEIGEIVELISDITEQTNAKLNAAIQACVRRRGGPRIHGSGRGVQRPASGRGDEADRGDRETIQAILRMRWPRWRSRPSAWSRERSCPTPRVRRWKKSARSRASWPS